MSDLGNSNWSEVDASNNAANPNGWPTGMFPNQTEATARAGMGATKRWYNKINPVYTTGGTSTAYTLTSAGAAEAAYYTGQSYSFIVNATCGATPTLNIDALGAINLRTFKGGSWGNAAAGDLQANQVVTARYNGTQFDVTNVAIGDFVTASGTNAFTGTNTFPTQAALNNSTRAATTAYADNNLIQIVTTSSTANTVLIGTYSTTSGAAPTTGGGVQITGLNTTFTPKSASSTLEITANIKGVGITGTDAWVLAIFNGSTLVDMNITYLQNNTGISGQFTLTTWLASPGVSAQNFTVRIGANSGTTFTLNSTNNGVAAQAQSGSISWLTIKEILPHP